MESFLNRYRNITVLLLVIFGQLVLLAVQVKNDKDIRMVRVWTVTMVTPVARVVEAVRSGALGVVRSYILLKKTDAENRRLQEALDKLKLENVFLKNELNTAERAKALQVFQQRTPSRSLAARVIGMDPGPNSKVVFVDRGSVSGIKRGMAVVTPDGIVGKVTNAYPTASEVLLLTDAEFAAGVVTQKNQVRGTLKGQGTPLCKVDYVPFEEKVEVGEWYYTSGDDRVFPRGFQVGIVKAVRDGRPYKEILVEPSGIQHGVEEVLILVDSVHEAIPDQPPANQPVYIAPAPPASAPPPPVTGAPNGQTAAPPTPATGPGTDADKMRTAYKALGDSQNHVFGEGLPGARPPDFTRLGQPPANGGRGAAPAAGPATPGTGGPAAAPAQSRPAASGAATPQKRPATPGPGSQPPDASRRANPPAGAPAAASPAGQPGSTPPR